MYFQTGLINIYIKGHLHARQKHSFFWFPGRKLLCKVSRLRGFLPLSFYIVPIHPRISVPDDSNTLRSDRRDSNQQFLLQMYTLALR